MLGHLLLIEDEEMIGINLKEFLVQEGYTVDWCKNGTQGAQAIQSNHYDLMIFDATLPGHSGLELIGIARQLEITTPIIIATAKMSSEHHQQCLDAGADCYLEKPFDINELLAQIKRLTVADKKSVD